MEKSKKKARKRQLDIDDKTKWGHRFEFRDRAVTKREVYTPVPAKPVTKKADAEPIYSSEEEDASNAFEYDLKRQNSLPIYIPRAKTQASIAHGKPRKRQKCEEIEAVKELLDEILDQVEDGVLRAGELFTSTFINCDLRYYNMDFITEKFGYFDVIVIDPPWRIRGGQRNSDSPFMFSNNKFTLEYDTLSNQEIKDIPVEKLSRKGFCFLWVLSSTMSVGYECLRKWGYECVDHLVWVKTTHGGRKAMVSHGFYFLHSTETCLVGYKCPPGERVEYRSKVSNDLIIADIRKKSQKPDQLYTIIDLMMPGAKKVEIFARNNNLRQGWLSLGNQIGEVFEKWQKKVHCDECKEEVKVGRGRYKSRREPNFDLCADCFDKVVVERGETVSDYFKFENTVEENILPSTTAATSAVSSQSGALDISASSVTISTSAKLALTICLFIRLVVSATFSKAMKSRQKVTVCQYTTIADASGVCRNRSLVRASSVQTVLISCYVKTVSSIAA
eukprot:CAMPEP_0204903310 /NCGR_PEP_ID=MMETSP1397-20131031/4170_1 /ASSEMBLY_ACC=CAM_ASM_000891 /TAXON_ID=49980 /ORGANISM="Climacostomum Climacostomum virens, Strain Stock W-24" /LENGTH=502 /DNA_ID=CAMNT_0052071919 /DNA_START=1606 /DNA_END=3115 /DNA_ORIENTATION=+